jgi:hypothetical protein
MLSFDAIMITFDTNEHSFDANMFTFDSIMHSFAVNSCEKSSKRVPAKRDFALPCKAGLHKVSQDRIPLRYTRLRKKTSK